MCPPERNLYIGPHMYAYIERSMSHDYLYLFSEQTQGCRPRFNGNLVHELACVLAAHA